MQIRAERPTAACVIAQRTNGEGRGGENNSAFVLFCFVCSSIAVFDYFSSRRASEQASKQANTRVCRYWTDRQTDRQSDNQSARQSVRRRLKITQSVNRPLGREILHSRIPLPEPAVQTIEQSAIADRQKKTTQGTQPGPPPSVNRSATPPPTAEFQFSLGWGITPASGNSCFPECACCQTHLSPAHPEIRPAVRQH